jgi:hypothetical protein
MSVCQISNTGGTLVFKAIAWEESQIFHPSIRPIPNTLYPYMDLSQFMIEVRGINFTVRLTDDEYATLQAIFAASTKVTLVLYNALETASWIYTGWLEEPDAKFEYKIENEQTNVRWWNVAMTVRCDTITGGSFGSLSDTMLTSEANFGAGILDATGIYLGFITDYDRFVTNTVWMPQWMNQVPTIDYSFCTKSLTTLTYEAKCSDADKWYLDQLFLNCERVPIVDIVNGFYTNAVIKEIASKYTTYNWVRPWITTLTISADEIKSITITLITSYNSGCVITETDLGIITIDGVPYVLSGSRITIKALFSGIHAISFIVPNPYRFYNFGGSGNITAFGNPYNNPTTFTVDNSLGTGTISVVYGV